MKISSKHKLLFYLIFIVYYITIWDNFQENIKEDDTNFNDYQKCSNYSHKRILMTYLNYEIQDNTV